MSTRRRIFYFPDGKVEVWNVDLKLKPVYVQLEGETMPTKYKHYNIESQIPDLIEAGAKVRIEENDVFIDSEFNNIPLKVPRLAGLDFEDMDTSQLPQERAKRNKWRGSKGNGVSVDETVVIREDLIKDLDDELEKPNPDLKKAMKLQRKLDKREHD